MDAKKTVLGLFFPSRPLASIRGFRISRQTAHVIFGYGTRERLGDEIKRLTRGPA
jgi:hypothetical protein